MVLLDDNGAPIGTHPKATVHTTDTPLHLAFSCFLLDADGRVLLTRRALVKRAWPGVWTNAFCGHPGPGEDFPSAIARRASDELGTAITGLREALPDFRYRAVDASGIVENEMCPVYLAELSAPLYPEPAEVMETAWIHPDDLDAALGSAPFAFSPWLRQEWAALRADGHV